jgi:cytochrome b561
MLKSKSDQYGSVAISLHWLTAVLIVALLGSGFRAANAVNGSIEAALLRFHIPVAFIVLLLTIVRLAWWWLFDRKPLPVEGSVSWQEGLAQAVHIAFYVVILGMVASGIGMIILSGAAPIIFGGSSAALPNFTQYAPRTPHGLGSFALIALVALHSLAALYHHFIRGDGLLWRMWYRK